MPDSSEAIAKQDTTHGRGWKSKDMILADGGGSNRTAVIELDAANQKLVINVRDSAGDPVAGAGIITIDLASLIGLGLTTSPLEAKFRLDYAKDNITCEVMQRAVLATEWEAVP